MKNFTPASVRPSFIKGTLVLFLSFFALISSVFATDYYWAGGAGSAATNIGAINTVSTTLGGARNAAVVTFTTSDRIYFDFTDIDGNAGSLTGTTAIIFSASASLSIGQLILQSGALNVTYNCASSGRNITFGGTIAGADFVINSGSTFTTTNSTSILILGTGTTGSISGTLVLGAGSNSQSITAADATGLTVNNGGIVQTNSNIAAFGAGTANSVIFANGSTYIHNSTSAANPFQLTQPASVVVFQTGSLYKNNVSAAPSFSGRTYANFEFVTGTQSSNGSAALVMDNLTVSGGSLSIGMTGTPGHSIKGNINVAASALLTFNGAGTMNIGGTTAQQINTAGTGSIVVASGQILTVTNIIGVTGTIAGTPGFVVQSGGTFNTGITVLSGAGVFNLNAGGTIGIGNSAGINTSGATGAIQTTTRTFAAGANYVYNSVATGVVQNTGTALPQSANQILSLTIARGTGTDVVSLTNSGITRIGTSTTNGTLTLTSGIFQIGSANTIDFTATSSGAGIVNNGGNIANNPISDGGTILSDAGSGGNFTLSGTGQTIFYNLTFTSNATFTDAIANTSPLINGSLTINNNNFAFSGASSIPRYGSTSSIIINNAGNTWVNKGEWASFSAGAGIIGVSQGYPNNYTVNADNFNVSVAGDRSMNGSLTINVSSGNTISLPSAANNILTIGGDLNITSGKITSATSATDIVLKGNYTRNTTNGTYIPSGRAIIFSGSGTAVTPQTINTSTGAAETQFNNITISNGTYIKLNCPVTLPSTGILTLTSGKLETTVTNFLSITNTAITAIAGNAGSATNCITGTPGLVKWSLASTGSPSYVFPIAYGTGSIAYLPFTLNSTNTVASNVASVQAFAAGGYAGTVDATLNIVSNAEYWFLGYSSSVNTGSTVKIGKSSIGSFTLVGKSTSNTGTGGGLYSSIGGSISGNNITSTTTIGTGTVFNFQLGTPPVPVITLADNSGGQVAAGNLGTGSTDNPIASFQLNVTTVAATLQQLTFITTGNAVSGTDITNFKLYYSATNNFASRTLVAGTGATLINGLGAGTHVFGNGSTLTQTVPVGINYFWITADIPGTAGTANLQVSAITTATDLVFATGTPTGSTSQAGLQTITILPTVTTVAASSITTAGATLNGTVNANGPSTNNKFDWGITLYTNNDIPADAPNSTSSGTSPVSISLSLSALTPNTLYNFRAKSDNGNAGSPVLGSNLTFTTLSNAPTVGSGTTPTSTGFTANWTAPAGQGNATLTYTVQIDDDINFGSVNQTATLISGTSAVITGLSSNTNYYYRVFAVNAGGSSAASTTSVSISTGDPDTDGNAPAVGNNINSTADQYTILSVQRGKYLYDATGVSGSFTTYDAGTPTVGANTRYAWYLIDNGGGKKFIKNVFTSNYMTYTSGNYVGFVGDGCTTENTNRIDNTNQAGFNSLTGIDTTKRNWTFSALTGNVTIRNDFATANYGYYLNTAYSPSSSNQVLVSAATCSSSNLFTLTKYTATPDLEITGVSTNINNNRVAINTPFTATATIRNNGLLAITNGTNIKVKFVFDGKIYVSTYSAGLAAGASTTLSAVSVTPPILSASSSLTVTVNSNWAVSEYNYSNNVFTISGISVLQPVISTTGTLSAVSTAYGTASAFTSYSVSGSDLVTNITVSAPAGFEVSQTSGGGSGYAATQNLTPSGTTVASTTVYVRLAATTVVGSYAGNVTNISSGATSQNVAVPSSSVTPAALTITGVTANNKSYDGTTTAALSGTPAYSGLQNGEAFAVTGTPSANFNNANVGTGKPVTVTGYTAPGSNYTVSQPAALTANITTAVLTITGITADNKSYDGTTTATLSGTPAYSGLQNGETFSVTGTPSANFNNANVGTGKPVTVTGYTAPGSNYTVSQPAALTANITTAALTITGVTANDKTYDGTTTATLSGTPAYAGLQNGETFSVTGTPSANFNNANVGTNKPVTVTDYTAPGSNYTVSQPTGLTADITGAAPTVTVTNNNTPYIYDGSPQGPNTASNTGTGSSYTFSYVGTGATTYGPSATQPTDVGTYTATATVAAEGNYSQASSSPAAFSITGAAPTVTVTGNATPYTYNGSPQGPNTASNSGTGTGYTFSYAGTGATTYGPSATQPTNAGTYTVTATVAADGNYAQASSLATAFSVTPLAVTVTPDNGQNKAFGGTDPAFTYGSSPALIGADVFTGALGRNAGEAIGTYAYTLGTLSAGSNYTISLGGAEVFTITGVSQNTADFRSQADGNFSSASTWEFDQGGGSWLNASQAPGAGNNVSITHNLTQDQNFTVGAAKTLTLGTGGTVSVNPTRTLTIAGTANFGGRLVTFKSTAAGVGSLGQVTGTLQNATNVTVERFIPSNGFRSWRLLGVPTSGSQTINASWQEGNTPLANNKPAYGIQIPGPGGTANGFDAATSGNAGSLLSWNGTGWAAVASTLGAISADPAKAYFVFVRGDRTKGIQGTNSNTSATTLETNGSVYVGDQTTPSIAANSFGLAGNRYASAINFTTLTRSNVDDAFYIWNSKFANGTSTGQYQTFSATNGYAPVPAGGGYGASNTTIESGQAFLVRNSSASAGTVTMHENSKISGTSGNLGLRPATPAALVKIDTRLHGNSSDIIIDGNAVVFDNAYGADVDSHDALKLTNTTENFAVLTGGRSLAVEGRPEVRDEDVIAFKMWNMKQQQYQLEFIPANFNTGGLTATLQDAYLHTDAPVSLQSATTIKFTIDANAASAATDRFRIVFKKTVPAVTGEVKPAFAISPNPAEGGVVNLQFINQKEGRYSVRLVNEAGQAVYTARVAHAGSSSTQVLNLPKSITTGTYRMEIVAPDKTRSTKTLFVNGK